MTLSEWLDAWSRLARLYEDGRYTEGAALAGTMRERFPERRFEAAFFHACFLGVQGDGETALDVLREIVEEGGWLPPRNLRDTDLDAARGEAFDVLADEMQRRYEAMLESAREVPPEMAVLRPNGTPLGVVLVLHMYGATADETVPHWEIAARLGYSLVVPESSQRDADGLPAWFDSDVALKDARSALELSEQAGLPLVAGGASQGARAASRMAMEGSLPDVRGFASVVSTAPDVDAAAYDDAKRRGVRAWILAGEHDGVRPQTEAFHADLIRRGFDVRLEIARGVGHDYPDDFDRRLETALPFLAG